MVIGEWAAGKVRATYDKFKSEFNVKVPEAFANSIDRLKNKYEAVFNTTAELHEFYAILIGAAMITLWIYITAVPWKYRMMVSVGILIYRRDPITVATAISSTIPKFWNWMNREQHRIRDNNAGYYGLIGALSVFAALSGQFSFSTTVGILGTGAVVFLVGCTQKAANHSISGANKATDIALIIVAASALMGIAYYQHDINRWYVCGSFSSSRKSSCERMLSEYKYSYVETWIRNQYAGSAIHESSSWYWGSGSDWGSSNKAIAYISMAIALAAISLPGIVNVMGLKYKMAGMAKMAALKRAKSESAFTPENTTVNVTLADFTASNDNIPAFVTAVIGVGYATYNTPVGIVLLTVAFTAQLIGYYWFKAFLSDDYAIEGSKMISITEQVVGQDGTHKTGRPEDNNLPYKSSLAVVIILSVCACICSVNLMGAYGIMALFIPGIMYHVKPSWMGPTALAVYVMTSTATGEKPMIALIALGCLLAANRYSMHIRNAKSEAVMTPLEIIQ